MNYRDGQKVHVGDKVKLSGDLCGTVVCSIDDDEYTSEYPKAEWSYLAKGVLIDSDQAGLIHLIEPDKHLELLERRQT